MAPIVVQSYQDGPAITVNDLIKNPTAIPRRIIDITNSMFLGDQLLRSGPPVPGGSALYFQTNPLFSPDGTEIVGEFGEIPVGRIEIGTPVVGVTSKRGLGMVVSREMADRNNMDLVNLGQQQVSNTMVRDWDAAFMAALLAAVATSGQTVSASAAWTNSSATPQSDILSAASLVALATLPGQANNYLGFNPDTVVLSRADVFVALSNPNIWKAYVGGDVASINPSITGRLPGQIVGMDAWSTPQLAQGTILVLERKTVGFISDERPLQATPLYYREEREAWRTDVTRTSLIAVDQPLAVASITGAS